MKESKNILTISLIAIIVITLFYINIGKNTQSITVSGNVINPKGDTIRIYYQDTSFITTLSVNGSFSTEFSLFGIQMISDHRGIHVARCNAVDPDAILSMVMAHLLC